MGKRLTLAGTPIAGLYLVETARSSDERGWFERLFCRHELEAILGERDIVQINVSVTNTAGSVRGLHYQKPPHAETKLVRCLRGRVWDVAVDLRAGSATFLRWYGQELSADNRRMIVIPEGFAHGFQALESGSELLYLHTAAYKEESEDGVQCDDPRLGISWPLAITQLSPRDSQHPALTTSFRGLAV